MHVARVFVCVCVGLCTSIDSAWTKLVRHYVRFTAHRRDICDLKSIIYSFCFYIQFGEICACVLPLCPDGGVSIPTAQSTVHMVWKMVFVYFRPIDSFGQCTKREIEAGRGKGDEGNGWHSRCSRTFTFITHLVVLITNRTVSPDESKR